MAKNVIKFEKILDEIIKLEREIHISIIENNTEKYSKVFEEQYKKKLVLVEMYNE